MTVMMRKSQTGYIGIKTVPAIDHTYVRPRASFISAGQGYSVILEEEVREREHMFVVELDVFSQLFCEGL